MNDRHHAVTLISLEIRINEKSFLPSRIFVFLLAQLAKSTQESASRQSAVLILSVTEKNRRGLLVVLAVDNVLLLGSVVIRVSQLKVLEIHSIVQVD